MNGDGYIYIINAHRLRGWLRLPYTCPGLIPFPPPPRFIHYSRGFVDFPALQYIFLFVYLAFSFAVCPPYSLLNRDYASALGLLKIIFKYYRKLLMLPTQLNDRGSRNVSLVHYAVNHAGSIPVLKINVFHHNSGRI